MKIKLTKEQFHLINSMGTKINDEANDYYYLPFWFKDCGDGEFEIIQFEKLPQIVFEMVEHLRG